jgi:hypothetical protein
LLSSTTFLLQEQKMNATVTTEFDTFSPATDMAGKTRSAVQHVPLNRLHPGVIGITAGAYVAMILTFWVGFSGGLVLTISLWIVTVCLAAFIGLPWIMAANAKRFWRRHGQTEASADTFRHFMNSKFETASGKVSGPGALALVATVPICLTFGAIAMAIILHAVR